MTNLKIKGTCTLGDIQEGDTIITFNPPLVIEYSIYSKKDENGKDNYPEDVPIMGFGDFDFGMSMTTPLDIEHNWLVNGYNGLTKDSEPQEILITSITYDLFHSLCHPKEDPNFSHYNHALFAYLQDRATIKDVAL